METGPAAAPAAVVFPRRIVVQQKSQDGSLHASVSSKFGPCNNTIRTSRYTMLTFLPMNLFEQFMHPANFFFLVVGVLQSLGAVSTTEGVPTIAVPLTIVLCVSGARAAIEDYRRHRSDNEQAHRKYLYCDQVSPDCRFISIESGRITPGLLVKVEAGQEIPADLVFLRSHHSRGHCFIESSNLDGETNLKVKSAVLATHAEGGMKFDKLELAVEDPNAELDSFRGELQVSRNNNNVETPDTPIQRVQLSSQNLLLRGTVLKNIDFILGLAVYTGEQTKIRCSSSSLSKGVKGLKMSTQALIANKLMLRMFTLQLLLCIVAAIASQIWVSTTLPKHQYLQIFLKDLHLEGAKRLFTYFILLSQMVPISFVVSLELVKTLQAFLIMADDCFKSVVVKTSSLTDELGQIGFVVSDKTGTLTENRMQLRQIICGTSLRTFGSATSEIHTRLMDNGVEPDCKARMRWSQIVQNQISARRRCSVSSGGDGDIDSSAVNTFDGREELLSAISSLDTDASRMVIHCALSNTVTPVHDSNSKSGRSIVYQSSSPDELELCEFARTLGYELQKVTPETVITLPGSECDQPVFQLGRLAALEFNSKRKRVTIVYRDVDSIVIMSKGADNVMLPLLSEPYPDQLLGHLATLAERGLRTLVFAEGRQPSAWWDKWASIWENASHLPEEGEEQGHSRGSCSEKCQLCTVAAQIELDAKMKFIGGTGLEDSLQFLVPETVAQLRHAGIRLVMLTGDKPETAFSIALAASFIARRTNIVTFLNESTESFVNTLNEAERSLTHQPPAQFAMTIEGAALHALLEQDQKIIDRFLGLHAHPNCQALICSRATPALKAAVVLHLRRFHKRQFGSILAIGDGANDEEMIVRADVGVGIAGLEGSAAARAADFSIHSFRELHSLMFVHGVWNYDRIAKVSHFIFYKAAIVPVGMFCFGIVSAFSGTQLYPEGLNTLNSVFFTGLPIIVIGVADRILDRKHLEDFSSEIYRSIRRSALFNEWSFFKWIASSFLDGITVFAAVFCLVDISELLGGSLEAASAAAFTALFILVTLRCLILSSSITVLHIVACVLCVMMYGIIGYILNRIPFSGLYGVLHHVFTRGSFPLVLLTVVLAVTVSMLSYMAAVALDVFWQKSRIEEVVNR